MRVEKESVSGKNLFWKLWNIVHCVIAQCCQCALGTCACAGSGLLCMQVTRLVRKWTAHTKCYHAASFYYGHQVGISICNCLSKWTILSDLYIQGPGNCKSSFHFSWGSGESCSFFSYKMTANAKMWVFYQYSNYSLRKLLTS